VCFRFIPHPEFEPSIVKKASTACEGLCKWARAMDVYDRIVKIVAPKKLKLAEAEDELGAQMDKLNVKRKQLQDVRLNILDELNNSCVLISCCFSIVGVQ